MALFKHRYDASRKLSSALQDYRSRMKINPGEQSSAAEYRKFNFFMAWVSDPTTSRQEYRFAPHFHTASTEQQIQWFLPAALIPAPAANPSSMGIAVLFPTEGNERGHLTPWNLKSNLI